MHNKTLSTFLAFLFFLTYTVVGAPVRSSQLTKRNYHTVQEAVHGISHKVGSGTTGTVYALKHTYQGHQAVIKVVHPDEHGQHWAPGPVKEAHNAHHVGQLLGHGHDAHTNTHYLVMKHMGVDAEHSGLGQAQRDHLNHEANQRYATDHGVRNKDQNGGNFVYHSHNGHPQAEVVDWAKTEHLGTHPKVAPMPVEPVSIAHSHTRKCPTCVVQ